MSLTLSQTEENYLKAIFSLGLHKAKPISTNQIADRLQTKASSVTDMIKKLAEKNLVDYKKYQGVSLTKEGKEIAVRVVRKHRLWEVFLVKHLDFNWDEVHELAEQLEHIKSNELTEKLDAFLEFPTHDPHGDPIPDKDGNIVHHQNIMLSSIELGGGCLVIGVKDSSSVFLKYLDKTGIKLGSKLKVVHREDFDNSMTVDLGGRHFSVSNQIAKNLFVKKI